MPRIRSIKPELWDDEALGSCPTGARLLFMGMISLADDAGRLRANVPLLKARLFAYNDDLTLDELAAWANTLSIVGVIRLYDHEGQTYAEIPNWLKHQRISHPSKSQLPAPEDSRILATIREARPLTAHGGYNTVLESDVLQDFPEDSGALANPPEASAGPPKDSVRKGREGRGREEDVSEPVGTDANSVEARNDNAEYARLTLLLADLIENNGSKRPADGHVQGWRNDVRLMVEQDERTLAGIEAAIKWSQGHDFWRTVVLSMGKLREKYDQMRLQAATPPPAADGRAAKVYDLRTACRTCERQLSVAERSSGWCDECFDKRAERATNGGDAA